MPFRSEDLETKDSKSETTTVRNFSRIIDVIGGNLDAESVFSIWSWLARLRKLLSKGMDLVADTSETTPTIATAS